MENLLSLEAALLEENQEEVRNFIKHLDIITANFQYQEAGKHFGFPVVIADGKAYAARQTLSKTFGYASESGLRMLFDHYNIVCPEISRFAREVRIKIRFALQLKNNDQKACLVDYSGFLVAGMNGENEAARKIKAYLIHMERAQRIESGKKAVASKEGGIKMLTKEESEEIMEMAWDATQWRMQEIFKDTTLTEKEMKNLQRYLKLGLYQKEIAVLLKRDPSTIRYYTRKLEHAMKPVDRFIGGKIRQKDGHLVLELIDNCN